MTLTTTYVGAKSQTYGVNSITFDVPSAMPVGAHVRVDATGGANKQASGLSGPVTDSQGNTYTTDYDVGDYKITRSVASASAVLSTALDVGDTITATFHASSGPLDIQVSMATE